VGDQARERKDLIQVTSAVGSENLDPAAARAVWPVLDKALAGKSWDGKEIVLEAFVRFVERGEGYWKAQGNEGVARELEKIATREGKRGEGKNEKVVEGVRGKLREYLKIE
jgi:proteasome component ECM29